MYRLYGNLEGWKNLGEYPNEDKLKETLASYFIKYDHIEYIIKNLNIDIPDYITILSEDDFYNYMDSGKGYSLTRKKNI